MGVADERLGDYLEWKSGIICTEGRDEMAQFVAFTKFAQPFNSNYNTALLSICYIPNFSKG